MQLKETALAGVMICQPAVFSDSRGLFFESFNQEAFSNALGESVVFVQDNHSHSKQHVLRGLHLQTRKPQGKLVRVTHGRIFDVAVDLRPESHNYGQWLGVELDSNDHHQLWIPPGFAHGFLTLSETADVHYKVTDYYDPGFEISLQWDDPGIGVQWPVMDSVLLSKKDSDALSLEAVVKILSETST